LPRAWKRWWKNISYLQRILTFLPSDDAHQLAAAGWLDRTSIQFHWHNQNYADFDDFLDHLSSRKRKNIRKERASITKAGVTMLRLTGAAITQDHIDAFFRFYMSTIDRKMGRCLSDA
jgi:predicted N-acyltransferase